MNYRLTMTMLAVLAIIGVFVAWVATRPETSPRDKTIEITNGLLKPQPKTVDRISLTRGGAVVVAFQKMPAKGGGLEKWRLTEPRQVPAESYEVESVATQLRELAYKDRFQPEPEGRRSMAQTGLAFPTATVKFTDDQGKEHTLVIGKRTPGKTMYAKLAEDSTGYIYEIDSGWFERLDREPSDFRAKELVDLGSATVNAITVARPNQTVHAVKADAKWVIDQPITTRANNSVLETMVTDLKGLRADSFTTIAKNSVIAGLETPVLSVTLSTQAPAPASAPSTSPASSQSASAPAAPLPSAAASALTVTFGNYTDLSKKKVYATVSGSDEAYIVSADTFSKLDRDLKGLRDPSVTAVSVTDATSIEINTPSAASPEAPAKITLHKLNGKWFIDGPADALPADAIAVGNFLSGLQALRAIDFPLAGDLKALGLDPAEKTMALTVPGQTQREVVLVGKAQPAAEGGAVTPLMRQGETTVYNVPSAEVAKLAVTLLALRDKTVDQVPPNLINEIEIAGKAATNSVKLVRQGVTWKISANGDLSDVDMTKVTTLLDNLSTLTAQQWTSLAPPPSSAGSQPAVTVKMNVELAPAPATAASAPATAAAGSQPASQPLPATAGPPLPGVAVVKTLSLYQQPNNSWTADLIPPPLKDGSPTGWRFEPAAVLVDCLTKTNYVPTPTTATAPATRPTP